MNDAQRERRQRLLSGLIDQELTPEEAAEANDLLVRDTEFRREYEQLRGSAAHIASLKFAEPHDPVLDQLWQSPFSRFSRNAGLLLGRRRLRPAGALRRLPVRPARRVERAQNCHHHRVGRPGHALLFRAQRKTENPQIRPL